jgi:hypothetical protein
LAAAFGASDFGGLLGFASAACLAECADFAESPEPDLPCAAGLVAEPLESELESEPEPEFDPESDPLLELEPESDEEAGPDADPPTSDRLFESVRLSVR